VTTPTSHPPRRARRPLVAKVGTTPPHGSGAAPRGQPPSAPSPPDLTAAMAALDARARAAGFGSAPAGPREVRPWLDADTRAALEQHRTALADPDAYLVAWLSCPDELERARIVDGLVRLAHWMLPRLLCTAEAGSEALALATELHAHATAQQDLLAEIGDAWPAVEQAVAQQRTALATKDRALAAATRELAALRAQRPIARRVYKRVERDADGRITGVIEEEEA
jgi:hypothetical protein